MIPQSAAFSWVANKGWLHRRPARDAWVHAVVSALMGWTPPDGIGVPKWRC
jgi:hypothetical protein